MLLTFYLTVIICFGFHLHRSIALTWDQMRYCYKFRGLSLKLFTVTKLSLTVSNIMGSSILKASPVSIIYIVQ